MSFFPTQFSGNFTVIRKFSIQSRLQTDKKTRVVGVKFLEAETQKSSISVINMRVDKVNFLFSILFN